MDPNPQSEFSTDDPDFDFSMCSIIPSEATFSLTAIYCIISPIALTFNFLVLWAIWPQVKSNEGIPSYVVNLLCAAILESVTLPFGISYLLYSLPLDHVACSVVYVIPTISQRIGAVFVVWIFVIRYVAITHPLRYHMLCSCWVCSVTSIFLWLTIIAISVVERIMSPDDSNLCFPDYKVAPNMALFDLVLSLLFGLLPLILLVIFWHLISRVLNTSPSVPSWQRRRISILLLFVVAMFGVLYGPLTGIRVHQSLLLFLGHSPWEVTTNLILTYQIVFALNTLCVVIVPLFYLFSSSRVNERIKGLFRKRPKAPTQTVAATPTAAPTMSQTPT
ncbi:G-protein coupled receptor 4-like [Pelodytes ibericus]